MKGWLSVPSPYHPHPHQDEERGEGGTTTSQQNQQQHPEIHQARNYLACVKSLLGETSPK